MSTCKERQIVRRILTWLNSLDNCRAIKLRGDAYCAGEPDILCVRRGLVYFFEVKRPGHVASRLQASVLGKWNVAGSCACVVTSLAEVQAVIGGHYTCDGDRTIFPAVTSLSEVQAVINSLENTERSCTSRTILPCQNTSG